MLAIPASRFWPGLYRYRGSRSLWMATIPGLVAAIAGVDDLTGYEISVKTVEAHRARMMGKLDVSSVAELVRLSVGWSKPGPRCKRRLKGGEKKGAGGPRLPRFPARRRAPITEGHRLRTPLPSSCGRRA